MTIPRAKKKQKPKISYEEFIRKANYLNLACTVRTLTAVFGFGSKRLSQFIEEYITLMEELYDNRNTVNGIIQDCKDLTGVDVKFILDNLEMNSKKEKK